MKDSSLDDIITDRSILPVSDFGMTKEYVYPVSGYVDTASAELDMYDEDVAATLPNLEDLGQAEIKEHSKFYSVDLTQVKT